jgi:hypothetical protein
MNCQEFHLFVTSVGVSNFSRKTEKPLVLFARYLEFARMKSGGAPHSKTRAMKCAGNDGHVLECGNALPLYVTVTAQMISEQTASEC